jgi:hypothetical protein
MPESVDVEEVAEGATPVSNQIVGNIGLYYVCYRLSCFGWNAMPTARNAYSSGDLTGGSFTWLPL